MMRRKQFLCLALAVLMCISLFPVNAFAEFEVPVTELEEITAEEIEFDEAATMEESSDAPESTEEVETPVEEPVDSETADSEETAEEAFVTSEDVIDENDEIVPSSAPVAEAESNQEVEVSDQIDLNVLPEEELCELTEPANDMEDLLPDAIASNPYPTQQDVDGDGYYEIPCTRVAWQQAYDNLGIALPAWQDGRTWAGYAIGSYPVVDYPVAPSIACWNSETENHVAFVTAVDGNRFWVNEGGRTDLDHTDSHGYAEGAEKWNSSSVSFIVLFDASTDHTSPRVTSGAIVFPREDGFWIRCSGQDENYLKQLRVGVWHSGVSVDAAVWADAYVGNGKTRDIFVSTAAFNYQRNVTYYANVYAIDYNNNVSAAYSVPSRYFESTPPRITSATIENVTSTGYDVRCSATDNVGISHFRIGTWHDAMSIDNAVWQQEVPDANGSVVIHVDMKDFGYGQDVTYHTNVFAYDTSGNVSEAKRAGDPWIENNLPKVTGSISNVTADGFDVICSATGFPAIASIQAGIWHDGMSIDNAKWQELAGASGVFHIRYADFGSPQNTVFHVNLFAFDTLSRRNQTVQTLDVTRDSTPPVVTSASLKNITSTGYDVVCRASDNFGVAKIRIGTWHDAMSIDDAVWTEVASDGSQTVIHVDMKDFGYGQDVTYHTNVFAIDTSGNVSEAVRAGDPWIENNLPRVLNAHSASVSDDGYDVVCSAQGYPAVSKIRVGTWHDAMSIDDAVWQEINGASGSVHIRYADFGDVKNVTYHSSVFVVDTLGRSSQSAYRAADVYHGDGSDEHPVEFDDVADPTAYYFKAVYWAAANGITSGTSPTTFSPGRECTRGQIVTFLWKAMGSPEPRSTSNPFTDVKESDYFYKPVLWAKEKGITSGKTATTFAPGAPCTRGQIVTFLWIAKGRPEPTDMSNPFNDVSAGDYFYKPVLWAKTNGITSGTSATTFSPGKTCTRAQAMTFLWNASGKP